MSQKTKIKKDDLGLYVVAGGWIARPFYGTKYSEGDSVKSHHFGGSTMAGVGGLDANFRKKETHEYWTTTGVMAYEYKDMSPKTIESKTIWYKTNSTDPVGYYAKHNKKIY